MRDEALAYAARLRAAGLPVTQHVFSKNATWPDALLQQQPAPAGCPCAGAAQAQFDLFFESTRTAEPA